MKRDAFVFSLLSLPTFSLRIILEIIQSYISLLAISEADRSTFSLVRIITIPFLLLVNIILGYVVGIGIIFFALLLLIFNKNIKKKGIVLTLFSSLNAVLTISLFKYDITHFNSVAAEQLIVYSVLLITFFLAAIWSGKENPLLLIRKPIFFSQSFSIGLGGVLESFAYNYGVASVIVAAKRSSAMFWSLVSGKSYFGEKQLWQKAIVFLLLFLGIIALVS